MKNIPLQSSRQPADNKTFWVEYQHQEERFWIGQDWLGFVQSLSKIKNLVKVLNRQKIFPVCWVSVLSVTLTWVPFTFHQSVSLKLRYESSTLILYKELSSSNFQSLWVSKRSVTPNQISTLFNIWLIVRCWGKSSLFCQQKSDAL